MVRLTRPLHIYDVNKIFNFYMAKKYFYKIWNFKRIKITTWNPIKQTCINSKTTFKTSLIIIYPNTLKEDIIT